MEAEKPCKTRIDKLAVLQQDCHPDAGFVVGVNPERGMLLAICRERNTFIDEFELSEAEVERVSEAAGPIPADVENESREVN